MLHNALLIHDDIEDNDALRYGEKTLHEEHGVPVALNVGDLLIGEGYRLIASCKVSAEQKAQMVLVASQGQRQLCRGQGAERRPGGLDGGAEAVHGRHRLCVARRRACR